jgi:hypothetical protein
VQELVADPQLQELMAPLVEAEQVVLVLPHLFQQLPQLIVVEVEVELIMVQVELVELVEVELEQLVSLMLPQLLVQLILVVLEVDQVDVILTHQI